MASTQYPEPPADPNAMDLSPGRVWLAQAEDYEPGRKSISTTRRKHEDSPQWDKGKSSLVSIVANRVTLKEIVDSL
jgi:hypothetical protein